MSGSNGHNSEDVWPTKEQEWLLRAALADREAALDAWSRWRSAVALDANLDFGSYRLLPLVYRRLVQYGEADPSLGRLDRIYRGCGADNQRLFRGAAGAVGNLGAAGIETLLLKGAPLVLHYYKDLAERPMDDVDVAVHPAQAVTAASVLRDSGFEPDIALSSGVFRFIHSIGFKGSDGTSIDLHWHVLFETAGPGGDDEFWDASEPVIFEGVATRALCASDQFLHVVVHGMKWNRVVPSLRWVADATTVLRVAGNDLDWNRVLRLAVERRVVLRLRKAVHYLVESIGVECPDGLLRELDCRPVTRLEAAEASVRLRSREKVSRRMLGRLELVLVDYWRLRVDESRWRSVVAFPHYLYFRWRIVGSPGLPRPLRRLARWARNLLLGPPVAPSP